MLNIQNLFPRKFYSIDHIRRRANAVYGTKSHKAFAAWLSNHLMIRRMHCGDSGEVQALITISIDLARSKPSPEWHEKSNAWRVRTGDNEGPPYYQINFNSPEEAKAWIDTKFSNLKEK